MAKRASKEPEKSAEKQAPLETATSGKIVWLASYPRSGNTWLQVFLTNLFALIEGREPPGADFKAMRRLVTWEIYRHLYEPVLGKATDEASYEETAAARAEVQRRIANSGRKRVMVKTHHAVKEDRGHPTINPEVTAGAIYLVRNPLDVAVSLSHHYETPLDQVAKILCTPNFTAAPNPRAAAEHYGSWTQNVESWTRRAHRQVLVLRYEDLLRDPLAGFTRVAQRLNLEATPEMIERATAEAAFDKLKAQEESEGYQEKPGRSHAFFRQGATGQWRGELSEDQVKLIIRTQGPVMARFGYLKRKPSDEPASNEPAPQK